MYHHVYLHLFSAQFFDPLHGPSVWGLEEVQWKDSVIKLVTEVVDVPTEKKVNDEDVTGGEYCSPHLPLTHSVTGVLLHTVCCATVFVA